MAKIRTFSIKDVEILDNETCFSGFLAIDRLSLRHRLYEGGWSHPFTREVLRRRPGVGVLLYDPDLDKVLMVEQFRAGCLGNERGPWMLELVAGVVEEGESPPDVAIREAREEAGVEVGGLIPVSEYYNSPGGSSEKLTVYCAGIDASRVPGIGGLSEENENILPVILEREEAMEAVRRGIVNNAMAIIALQWLALNLEWARRKLTENREAKYK